MFKLSVVRRKRFQDVSQHGEVLLHLFVISPAGDQSRLLVQGGVHHVGDVAEVCGHASLACQSIVEIKGYEIDAEQIRWSSGESNAADAGHAEIFKYCATDDATAAKYGYFHFHIKAAMLLALQTGLRVPSYQLPKKIGAEGSVPSGRSVDIAVLNARLKSRLPTVLPQTGVQGFQSL